MLAEKSLTELLQELVALEDNAHNLADAQGAIRTKEREVIKGFATAYDELKALFQTAHIEPLVEAAKKQITLDYAESIEALGKHVNGVVEQAKTQLDEAKVQVADAVAGLEGRLTEFNVSVASHAEAIDALQDRVASIADHPALSIPALETAAEQPSGQDPKPAQDENKS